MTSPAAQGPVIANVQRTSRAPTLLQHGAASLIVVITASLIVVLTWAATRVAAEADPQTTLPPSFEILMPDTSLPVSGIVDVVRRAASAVPDSSAERELQIVFTDVIDDGDHARFVAGRQRGSVVQVRVVDTAMPTRTLIHELAHAVTPGDGHGERFTEVYLRSIAEIFDDDLAAREARRLAWVYDRCYLDDSCPQLDRAAARR